MTWSDQIENKQFKITTGDGVEWFPLFKITGETFEFNNSMYEYPGLEGTFVDRRLIKGGTRVVNFFFQGNDCFDQKSRFIESSKDKRSWIIDHPFDGIIRVQPISIQIKDDINLVTFNATVQETIEQEGIRSTNDAFTRIQDSSNNAFDSGVANLSEQVITSQQALEASEDMNNIFDEFEDIINDPSEASTFKNLVQQADRLSQQITTDTVSALIAINDVYKFVGTSIASTRLRITGITNAIRLIYERINPNSQYASKTFSAWGAMSQVNTAALITATPQENEYQTRVQVSEARETLRNIYNETVIQFEKITREGRTGIENYELAWGPFDNLFETVNITLGLLDQIAFDAKIEVEIITPYNTNLFNLAFMLYGSIGPNDENINEIIRLNDLGPAQMIEIKQGTPIIYLQ